MLRPIHRWSPNTARPRPDRVFIALLAIPILLLCDVAFPVTGPLNEVGRWSGPFVFHPQNDQVVHMVVMRDAEDSLRVLFWGASGAARLWMYADGLDTTSTSLAVPNLVTEEFCSGHSGLDDGTVLISGGSLRQRGETGLKHLNIFDLSKIDFSQPENSSNPENRGWVRQRNMVDGRWYPTNTALGDGKTLVTSGMRYSYTTIFGGRVGGSLVDDLRAFAQHESVSVVTPSAGGTGPTAREGHSAVYDPHSRRMIVFGGYDGVYKNDLRPLVRTYGTNNDAETWTWQTALSPQNGPPGGRSRHSAIFQPSDTSMVLFGGENGGASALPDGWRLYLNRPHNTGQWVQLANGPQGRYGHSAVFDAGPSGGQARMIIFGGRDGTTYRQDVWVLTLSNNQWSQPTITGGPPPGREGHTAAVFRTPDGSVDRMFVFGGQDATEYKNDVWVLDLNTWTWTQLQPVAAVPAPRARHAAVIPTDAGFGNHLIVTGGNGPNGAWNSTWRMKVNDIASGADWESVTTVPSPSARYGHTMIDDSQPSINLSVDRFDKAAGGSQQFNYPRNLSLYPLMFLLPNGKLFYAGVADGSQTETRLLDLSTGWSASALTSPDAGATAVMYRPGRIMKCGGAPPVAPTDTISFDANGLPGVWATTNNPMPDAGRTRMNLTVLPNGQVLATGGKAGSTPTLRPRLWNPQTAQWIATPALEPEPAPRGYHSTAALLPDGRILSSGGFGPDTDYWYKATVYWPPYLFNSSGALATRPQISGIADTIGYGKTVTICTPQPSSIASAALIKPSAVTHAFNQDQRYVPLPINTICGTDHILVSSPANGNIAPPGDYMLFIVDNSGVPANAKWVRISATGGQDDCDAVAPAQISDVTVTVSHNKAVVSWTAPGDDGLCGTAHSFDVRYSSAAITEANFASASVAPGIPVPGPSGTLHCVEITGLEQCKDYWFAVKVRDDNNRIPPIAVATKKTKCTSSAQVYCEQEGLMAGGGGGGEQGAVQQQLGWDSALGQVQSSGSVTTSTPVENSLLWGFGENVSDLLRMNGVSAQSGSYTVRIRGSGNRLATLDQLSLGVVDHDADSVAISGQGKVFLGALGPVAGVTDMDGRMTPDLPLDSPASYDAKGSQYLLVDLGDTSGDAALVIESSGRVAGVSEDSIGILVQKPEKGGGWTTIATVHPRHEFDQSVVDAEGNQTLRVVFLRDYSLRSLKRMNVTGTAVPQPLTLVSADKDQTSVKDAVDASGGASTSVEPGDTLNLTFAATPVATGMVRDVFLTAKGSYQAPSASSGADLEPAAMIGAAPVYQFALGSAQPNPSSGCVNFSFTMAKEGLALIRVYDVAGRLVKTLVNGNAAAGPHELVWDASDDRGRRVRAGVYFYRMDAGSWRSQRKVVFLEQ